ncbi:glycoside hydrolase family 3 N-terminal domain-containing protein [Microbacterium sp. 13-71-7]|uniref:glycoside hydrolase family 3 protein n=1 Tax=Microbacterium sp. 13-71-7 TaxID=1970399 RepID=UPI000BD12E47|nr:glycoside hydrolase family 3 N-terminal domain-containing protein [Microbacterium sp. 13-71-7]OZB84522.1 MAG: beta-glucosidase [Microbacterium sp. 13-71-7]
MRAEDRTTEEGVRFRDLNGNGVMDPYEDPRLGTEERVEDLLARLSIEEKAGLLFHTVIEIGEGGELREEPGAISKSPTSQVVRDKHLTHFNVHGMRTAREGARWNNRLQELAAGTPHGIPVTISTDPRHAFVENSGVAFAAGPFSQWPEPLGLAALDDVELVRRFARIAGREYRAVGIRMALHPQVDLPTEARWGRQAQTLGYDADRVTEMTGAYLEGFQGAELGPESVACITKHFPGGGPQLDGEDAHFPYGREQVYPGGRFEEHLRPFVEAIRRDTAGIMPYYGMPVGLVRHGEPIEEVGFSYSRQIVTELLREELGYDGVVLSDWELINDNHVGDQVLPARAWGVEDLTPRERMLRLLDAGVDQFGGEECVELLLGLVAEGAVAEERIVGAAEFRAEGERAQAASVTVLQNSDGTLPLFRGERPRVYAEGVAAEALAEYADPASSPEDADVALVRIGAPFEPRNDLFLEAWFHQGSLDFPPGLVARLRRIATHCSLVIVVNLDRPAILTPFVPFAAAIAVEFGSSDAALLAALSGRIPPRGVLPVDIPRSMDAVRAAFADVPDGTEDPVFRRGTGLTIDGPGAQ